MEVKTQADFEMLSAEEQAWLVRDEQRWARAHEIAGQWPDVDIGGIYRVLRNLEKTPSERLAAALHHGRLFRIYER